MIRPSSEALRDDDNADMDCPVVTAHQVVGVRKLQEELASARCPLCRAVLVARQGRAGPYFDCRCVQRAGKRAS